jgi:hypothetical protein
LETDPARIRVWDSDGRALYFIEVAEGTGPDEIRFAGESGVKDRLRQVMATGEYLLRRRKGNLAYRFVMPTGISPPFWTQSTHLEVRFSRIQELIRTSRGPTN